MAVKLVNPESEIKESYRRGYLLLLESMVSLRPTVFSEVRDILGGLFSFSRGWIQRWIPDYYTRGRERALQSPVTNSTVRSVAPRGSIPQGQHRADIETLAYNLYGDLVDSLSMVGRRVNDRLREVGLEEALAGRIQGETAQEIKDRLVSSLEDEGITGITDASGREWRPDTYAEMAARTTLTEAQNLGMLNQLEDEGVDLVKITEHNASCPICAQYEGRVYSISGRDSRYPALRGTAFSVAFNTIHPNCRHSLEPYSEENDDEPKATRKESNRPFEDDRTEAEKRAYQEEQNRKRRARERRRKAEEEAALDV